MYMQPACWWLLCRGAEELDEVGERGILLGAQNLGADKSEQRTDCYGLQTD